MKKQILLGLAGLFSLQFSVFAATPMMSTDWGTAACDAWNSNTTLTNELAGDNWAANDGGKGYKIMHLYRMDCSDAPTVELQVSDKEGKAMCIYGGAVQSADLDTSYDYVMYAKTKHWVRMGTGEDGAMKAMALRRLRFEGPKIEAMSNMGPFGSFLMLTGSVEGDTSICP